MNKVINLSGFSSYNSEEISIVEKAHTEGVYADTPANRKLGRVGMSYKKITEKSNQIKNLIIGNKKVKTEPYLSSKNAKKIVSILKDLNIPVEQKKIKGEDCYYFTVGKREYGLEDRGIYIYDEDYIKNDFEANLKQLSKDLNNKEIAKITLDTKAFVHINEKPGPLSKGTVKYK